MTPKEFYESLQEKKPFTELTSTGISNNLPNVFEFAKMYAEAINYTHSCEELPTSTQLLSDCKKRFKELEGKANLDFRSYKNGYYLDSLSKNVISKIK